MNNFESDVSAHGKAILSFLQNEQIFIEKLNELLNFLLHPGFRGKITKMDVIIQVLNDMISYHQHLYGVVISGKSSLATALTDFPTHLKKYVLYSSIIQSHSAEFQNCSEVLRDTDSIFSHLLFEPVTQISRYWELFQNLCDNEMENEYSGVFLAVQNASDEIKTTMSTRKNAFSILQIQRLLIGRQPKILKLGRILLKEGILYKVSYRRSKMKKIAMILFDDLLLCCKVLTSSFDWHSENSLKCFAVFPLYTCSIHFASRGSSVKGCSFKVKSGNMSFMFMSKIPGDAQSWIQELQAAIRKCKQFTDCRNINVGARQRKYSSSRLQILEKTLVSCWKSY